MLQAFDEWRKALRALATSLGADRFRKAQNDLFWRGRDVLRELEDRGEDGPALRAFEQAMNGWTKEMLESALEGHNVVDGEFPDLIAPSVLPKGIEEAGRAVEHEMAEIEAAVNGRMLAEDGLLGRVVVTVHQNGGRMLRRRLHQLHRPNAPADPSLSKLLTGKGPWCARGIGTIDGEVVILGVQGNVLAERLFLLGTKPLGEG